MFENAKEKRVMREANRIVSLKEDMDVVSWERVLEIGRLLQEEGGREKCAALGSELVDVARSNLSLFSRFGIDSSPAAHIMPSGIEVLEGGLAEAALEEQLAAQNESPMDEAGEGGSRREISVPVHPEQLFSKTRSIESLRSEQSWDELFESSDDEGQRAAFEPESELEPEPVSEAEMFEPEEPSAMQAPVSEQEKPAVAAVEQSTEGSARVAVAPQDAAPAESSQASAPKPAPQPVSTTQSGQRTEPRRPARERFARFHTLYESRDHSLCVFEDEHGHLVAVDASKLA